MKWLLLVLIQIYFSLYFLNSQSIELGSWNIINLKYHLNEKWSVFGETQLRSLKFYDDYHYYEYKGGVNLKINPYVTFTLGGGSYQTYMEGGNFVIPKNNDEIRIWPQVILSQNLGSLKIEQRYRSEFRFTNKGYRNRYRYRLGLTFPISKIKEYFKSIHLIVNNELFFTTKEAYFERNRFLVAVSYKLSNSSLIQIGYLHQFDYKINDEIGRDFLQIGYFLELFHLK